MTMNLFLRHRLQSREIKCTFDKDCTLGTYTAGFGHKIHSWDIDCTLGT